MDNFEFGLLINLVILNFPEKKTHRFCWQSIIILSWQTNKREPLHATKMKQEA